MGTPSPRRPLPGLLLALLLCGGALPPPAGADPFAEWKTAAGLETVDAGKLLRGEIIGARGTQGSFARGVYVESAYFIKAPMDAVEHSLLHWNPAKYRELEVAVSQTYHWPAAPEVFRSLQLSESHARDRTLVEATAAAPTSGPGDLHLRPPEIDLIRESMAGASRAAGATAAWQRLLHARSEAMGASGLAGQPPYTSGGITIAPLAELRSLLKMTPSIASRFAALTDTKSLVSGGPGTVDETQPYADQSQVRNHTSFSLGVLAARKLPGSWQVLDCTYYTADTYFVSLTLYQLWPWENGTLVWQIDYASAPFRSHLGGIDKLFAGREMVRESAQTIQIFRHDTERDGR